MMTNETKIYLVRHGAILQNNEKCFIGQTDLPLNEIGKMQAEHLRDKLAHIHFSFAFCSDLKRSVETADIICVNRAISPVYIRQLREINMGLWDGLTFKRIQNCYPNEFEKRGKDMINYMPPMGESFALCAERVILALNEVLKNKKGNILIVGHAGVNRIIICHALDISLENIFAIKQDYCCLNIISFVDDSFSIEVLNKV